MKIISTREKNFEAVHTSVDEVLFDGRTVLRVTKKDKIKGKGI